MMKQLLVALTLGATLASPAAALEPLSQNKYINDRLVAARVADRIRRECPTISARMIYAFQQARKLKKYAEDQGYSGDQIDAYLDSRPDKDRIYGIAEKYLKQEGAKPGDAESFCRVGRSEIEKNTVSGTLLSAK